MKTLEISSPSAKILDNQEKINVRIQGLDPLGLDSDIRFVPELNKNKDVAGLIKLLYKHIPQPEQLEAFSYEEAQAVMRDLGIFLGSIRRHGEEPVGLIPELDYVLGELNGKTDMPPRDTLTHYTTWNPGDHRMRSYTGTEDEKGLIESVKISAHPLHKAIYLLIDLKQLDFDREEYGHVCDMVHENFGAMVKGVVHAHRNVDPYVFANDLRFYFDPITIYRREFIGPGAVELPVFVYDHLLWSSQWQGEEYNKFKKTYLPFNLPCIRDVYYNYDKTPSILKEACDALQSDYVTPIMLDNGKKLMKLCKQLKSFRMPHLKLAKKAYDKDKTTPKNRKTGSGGYSTNILEYIIEINLRQIAMLQKCLDNVSVTY